MFVNANKAFDVLNCRSNNCIKYKKALYNKNIDDIRKFTLNFDTYIQAKTRLNVKHNFY